MSAQDSNIEFAPIRDLDDFILNSARFQIPPYKELERWNNRIISNLLYYQTNYFVLIFVVFLLVGFVHPRQIVLGCIAIGVAFAAFAYATTQIPPAVEFKKEHPFVSLCLILVAGYILVSLFTSVIVFIFGIALPMLLMFLHASTRLRSLKNKVGMKLETVGFKKTPMGHILNILDIKVDLVKF